VGIASLRAVFVVALFALTGCVIHHVRAYAPQADAASSTEDAAAASTNCFEASTDAERLACGSATLAGLNRTLVQTLQDRLGAADFAGRDVLLAAQRAWLLGLAGACHLHAAGNGQAEACLAARFRQQTASLAAWPGPPAHATAVAQYVHYTLLARFPSADQRVCDLVARDANAALARVGSVDPAFMPQASEIAGTHGAESGAFAGRQFHVELHVANAYGGFARRARAVQADGNTVLDSVSLGNLLQQTAVNQGARFSAYASQTGDYGSADVFSLQGRTLALLADAWGFDAPASPGDFAHAGVWDLGARPTTPLCLFETFQMPADTEVNALASFAAWRDALSRVRQAASPADLGVGFLRDQAQMRAETEWSLLHMPLLATQQVLLGGWTNWLRIRHDTVLDALFAWAQADASRRALFDQVFALLRPAAQDLVRYYQQTQALSGTEAKQAAGLAIMEYLYGATMTIAPDLAADLQAPGSAAGQKPRYPILASPN
jgi:uncharacterized protein YecT (DUF1311 family)